tara:strand:+ start:2718 stop:2942 length:225 start_codon:yes stop_codon:yes gene_type:complete
MDRISRWKKGYHKRITSNKILIGIITLFLLQTGWEHMIEKEHALQFTWGLVLFSIGFLNAIPCVLKLIDGKGLD